MPTTESPNYVDVVSRPIWSNGSEINSINQKRVVAGVDEIKAVDINNIRDVLDLIYNHSHEYTDSKGSC